MSNQKKQYICRDERPNPLHQLTKGPCHAVSVAWLSEAIREYFCR